MLAVNGGRIVQCTIIDKAGSSLSPYHGVPAVQTGKKLSVIPEFFLWKGNAARDCSAPVALGGWGGMGVVRAAA